MNRRWIQIAAIVLLMMFGYLWMTAPYRQSRRGRLKLPAPDRITMENVIETLERDELWNYLSNLIAETPNFFYDESAHDRLWNSLPSGLQMLHILGQADSEMLNGGIRQVMQNMSAYDIEAATKSFRAIGATNTAELFEQAISVYKSKGSWKPAAKSNYPDMSNWSDEEWENHPILDAIDAARCNDEASRRDWKLFDEYVRHHPEQFLHDGLSYKAK
jgi:hypothetical protein